MESQEPLVDVDSRKAELQKQKKAASIYLACGVVSTVSAIFFVMSSINQLFYPEHGNNSNQNEFNKGEDSTVGEESNFGFSLVGLCSSVYSTGSAAKSLYTANTELAKLN